MKPRYQVYLYPAANRGYGRRVDKRRGFKRWFVSYETRRTDNSKPRREIEWLDVETREEAREARDRRYTELLLAGAKWKGQEPKKLPARPPKKKKLHPDDHLQPNWIKRRFWRVVINGEYIGGSYSKVEARKIRDNHLKQREVLRPCLCCGKRPVWGGGKRGNALMHDEPDCPAYAIIKHRDISKMRKALIWAKHLRNGKFPIKGVIHKSKIEHLL